MRPRMLPLGVVVTLAACAAPAQPSVPIEEAAVRFVALGDSYTIGTSVDLAERWPNQLVAAMGGRLALVGNPAVNGSTSADIIREQLPQLDGWNPELVSVLIGVNDVVQGVEDATYRSNVATILDDLLGRLPANRIVCIATPDYTVTPRGADFGVPARHRAGIVRVNDILHEECERRGIAFVDDIFAISGRVASDASLVASDGLHPSGAQYALWVEAIQPVIEEMLGD